MKTMVIQCAWCRQIHVGADYVQASPVPWVDVSHGICPDCFQIQIDDLRDRGADIGIHAPEHISLDDETLATRVQAAAA